MEFIEQLPRCKGDSIFASCHPLVVSFKNNSSRPLAILSTSEISQGIYEDKFDVEKLLQVDILTADFLFDGLEVKHDLQELE